MKPISTFVSRWEALADRVVAAKGCARIGVVGAGAGGVEMLLAMQHGLARRLGALGDATASPELVLFAGGGVLPRNPEPTQRIFRRTLRERGITVHEGTRVVGVDGDALRTCDGVQHRFDEVLWVTQAIDQQRRPLDRE